MRFTIAAAAALVAGAQAHYVNNTTPAYTTEVVSEYTTYCPGPTKITEGGNTYTVTAPTSLVITVTKPIPTPTGPVYTPPVYPTAPPPPPYHNASTPVYTPPVGTGTGAPTTPALPTFTGAANKAFAASGAGLAAVFGLAAYML